MQVLLFEVTREKDQRVREGDRGEQSQDPFPSENKREKPSQRKQKNRKTQLAEKIVTRDPFLQEPRWNLGKRPERPALPQKGIDEGPERIHVCLVHEWAGGMAKWKIKEHQQSEAKSNQEGEHGRTETA